MNFLLFLRLTATYATKMTAIIIGLENSWKYTRRMTHAAIMGSDSRSFDLGVKPFTPYPSNQG